MATTENISSNYAGEAAQKFFSGVLLSPTTIANGGVTPIGGIQHKWNIPKLDLSGIVGDATCDFTSIGTVDRSEAVLTLEKFQVNELLCKSKYRPTFDNMGGSRHGGLAPTFADSLIQLVGANVAESRENVIWKGVNATGGEFDGFEVLFTSQADQPASYEVTGAVLSAANIITELGKVRDAASSALYSKEGFAIRISTAAKKFYISAMASLGYMDKFHDGQAPLNFEGIPLIHCAGLSDDIMFATYSENLYYGFGEAGDAQRVDLIDTAQFLGDDNVRVVMKWADNIQVARPDDVITYGIVNTAN